MAGLKREDEHRLLSLRQRVEAADPTLTETDLLWLSVLEDRYAFFLEEGVKALKAASAQRDGTGSTPPSEPASPQRSSSFLGNVVSKIGGRLRSTSTAAVATSAQLEAARLCKHWTWVADRLIVGALPLADPTAGDPSAHLTGLRDQCRDRSSNVSIVVSALELDEASAPDLVGFASPRDWEEVLGTSTFVQVALPADPTKAVTTTPADMAAVCVQVHDAIVHKGECVYVHCKAGLGRSWCVVMCYLIAQRNMTLGEAESMLCVLRPTMVPSDPQRAFVVAFEDHIRTQRAPLAPKAQDEERYYKLLADLLSLPPQYRTRLVRDLEQLT